MPNREFAFPCLHGLRGILALWVLVGHMSPGGYGVIQLPRYGGLAVDMFFCMSGFLLMQSHYQDFERTSVASVRRFLLLRFWRTFPVHLTTLCLAAVGSTVIFGFLPSILEFIRCAVFVDTWLVPSIGRPMIGTIWSLHFEWIGYLVFPWICLVLLRLRPLWLIALLMVMILGVETEVMVSIPVATFLDVTSGSGAIVRMFGGLLIGCLFWTMCRHRTPRFGDWLMAVAIGLTTLILLFCPAVYSLGPVLAIVLLAAYPGPATAAILGSPVLAFFGRISFALYMVHYSLVRFFYYVQHRSDTSLPGAVFTACAIAASISAATAICLLVEEPLRRFGRGGTGRVRPPPDRAPRSAAASPALQKEG